MSIIVRYGTYTNTQAELSLEGGRVVSHWGRVVSRQLSLGRVVLGRVVGGPSCLPIIQTIALLEPGSGLSLCACDCFLTLVLVYIDIP